MNCSLFFVWPSGSQWKQPLQATTTHPQQHHSRTFEKSFLALHDKHAVTLRLQLIWQSLLNDVNTRGLFWLRGIKGVCAHSQWNTTQTSDPSSHCFKCNKLQTTSNGLLWFRMYYLKLLNLLEVQNLLAPSAIQHEITKFEPVIF
jgi:hypothetical protein